MNVQELVETLVDDGKWPTYRNSKALSKLEALAREAFERNTFDGYLSFVLITHQCNEDFVLILIKQAHLAMRICLVQHGFGWSSDRLPRLDGEMTGKLLNALESSLDFEGKKEFIQQYRNLNVARNKLAHKLIDGVDLKAIRRIATEVQRINRTLTDLFNDADEAFSWLFVETIGRRVLDEVLAKEIAQSKEKKVQLGFRELLKQLEKCRSDNPTLYDDRWSR